jgi:hypothetical protein
LELSGAGRNELKFSIVFNTDSEMRGVFFAHIFAPFYLSEGCASKALEEVRIRRGKQAIFYFKENVAPLFKQRIGFEIHTIPTIVEHFSMAYIFFIKICANNGRVAFASIIDSFFHLT